MATLQLRHDTTVNWNTKNPILAPGEVGIEMLTLGNVKLKVGNGTRHWTTLPYVTTTGTGAANTVTYTPTDGSKWSDPDPTNVQDALDDLATSSGSGGSGGPFQPLSSDLSAIALLATTAYGRALLGLVDAAALRTSAGLGDIATHNASEFDAAGAANTAKTQAQTFAIAMASAL